MFDIFEITTKFRKIVRPIDIIIIIGLIGLFLITRLINLDNFPIFGDEGIYIRWAKVAQRDAAWRFISLTDGRQPLHTWGMIPFIKLFPDNLLLAGRLFSVVTGFIAMAGLFVSGFYLLGKKYGYFAALIYILTPYFIFYDRMALIDSGVNAAFIWIFLFSIFLVKNRRLDIAIIFGLLTGVAMLTKSSIKLFILLAGLAPMIIWSRKNKKFIKESINYYLLLGLVGIFGFIIYNIQRLSPNLFQFVSQKNNTFILTLPQLLNNPFAYFNHNVYLIFYYVLFESGLGLGITGFLGWLLMYKKDRNLFWYSTAWWLVIYLTIAFVAIVLYPRYLIFIASFWVISSLFLFERIKKYQHQMILIIFFIITVFYYNYTILFDFKNIPFPPIDRGQYITGTTAGWGTAEIVSYAREKSQDKTVILMAEGDFGVIGDMLQVFVRPSDNIRVEGYWPLDLQQLNNNKTKLNNNIVLVVFSHRQSIPSNSPVQLIKKYPKPYSNQAYYLYELMK